jgi:hypothetical protein
MRAGGANRNRLDVLLLEFWEYEMPLERIPTDSPTTAHFLACHTLPLGIKKDATDRPHQVVARATFSLLEISAKRFFVTCAHVLDKFEEIQVEYPNAQLAAYTTIPHFTELFGFNLVDSESKILDVAIFRGLEDIIELPSRNFIPYKGSYLDDPGVGEYVCIVGYPRENVDVTEHKADLNYTQLILPISSVSDRHVVLADETGERKFHDFFEPENTSIDFGGLSGSAAYVLRNFIYRFVGIVKECHERDHTILISRLGCLNPDGTIDRSRMPY